MQQLSIDLVDRPGELDRVITILATNHIDIRALSLGHCYRNPKDRVVKMIVTNVPKALAALAGAGIRVTAEEVLIAAVKDEPGGLHKILSILSSAGLNIEHIYSFVTKLEDRALAVLSLNDTERAESLLDQAGIDVIQVHPTADQRLPSHNDLSDFVGGDYSWAAEPPVK